LSSRPSARAGSASLTFTGFADEPTSRWPLTPARLQAPRATLLALGVIQRGPATAELHGDAGAHAAECVHAMPKGGAVVQQDQVRCSGDAGEPGRLCSAKAADQLCGHCRLSMP
jgi:hypothetical protein